MFNRTFLCKMSMTKHGPVREIMSNGCPCPEVETMLACCTHLTFFFSPKFCCKFEFQLCYHHILCNQTLFFPKEA